MQDNASGSLMKSFFLRIIFLLLIFCFILPDSISYAAKATLTWDPPVISTDVAGYMIHYGTASRVYSQVIDVGNTTSFTLNSLNDGQTYYFTTTAYNHAGMQSTYSNELKYLSLKLPAFTLQGGQGDQVLVWVSDSSKEVQTHIVRKSNAALLLLLLQE
jgi:hypothetical protein